MYQIDTDIDAQTGLQTEICSRCTTETYIVNRTHHLCQNCNYHRLHGISYFDHLKTKQAEYKKRQIEKQKAKQADRKTQPINIQSKTYNPNSAVITQPKIPFFSKKGKERYDVMLSVKKSIRDNAKETDTSFCAGCLKTGVQLDCSHILSIAQRLDLQHEKDNINLLCRCCHQKWESGDIEKMTSLACFMSDIQYIYQNDETKFNKILFKIQDYLQLKQNKRIEYILNKIEKFD